MTARLTIGTADDTCANYPIRSEEAGTEFFVPKRSQHGHLSPCRPGYWQKPAAWPENCHAEDYLAGFPQVIFDPIGATIDNFLDKVTRFLQSIPASLHSRFWDRIVYVDMSGKDGVVVPFPLYYKLGTERSLLEVAERYPQTIIKSNPALFQAQVLGWPPLHRIGDYSGIVLGALGYQITEAEDLLDHQEAWEASGRFAQAEQVSPEAKRAVSYFRNKYIPMREADRARLTTPFLDKIFTFSLDETFGRCLA
jgi:hypothetical protein